MLDSRAMRIAIVVLTLALASLGCTKKDAAAPTEPETPAKATSAEPTSEEAAEGDPSSLTKDVGNITLDELPDVLKGDTPAIGGAPTVEVIEPGSEPRTALRFSVAPGYKQDTAIELGYAVEAVVVVLAVRNPYYSVLFDLSMRTTKARAEGAIGVVFEVQGAELDLTGQSDKRARRLEQALKGARKVSGGYTLSARGEIQDLTVQVPKGAIQESHDMADILRVALHQVTPVLPKEPVGAGATWTVHEGILQGGVKVNQLRTFELVSLNDGIAELKVAFEQSAARQSYTNPGKPMPLDLRTLNGDGEGSLAWDFAKLTPVGADLKSTDLRGIRQMVQRDGRPEAADVAAQAKRTVRIGAKRDQ